MPSLRKRVSTYFRQLSFHNEPTLKRNNVNENSFVTKYLQGHITLKEGPPILNGKNPTDLPNYDLGRYETGSESIVGCYSGPNGGLTTVRRVEKHLSVTDADIDFIDTPHEEPQVQKSPEKRLDNGTMVIKVAGREYRVSTEKKREKSRSLGSLSDLNEKLSNNNSEKVKCKNDDESECCPENSKPVALKENPHSYSLAKSKSEGDPFGRKKRGKIIRITQRPVAVETPKGAESVLSSSSDESLPKEWNRKSECCFGLSDSLYDRNQVTKNRNGEPIADCFGVIARNDSAVLALADGVNWGEKASLAAKSAVHGCLHYLNKTIFNDTKPFDDPSSSPATKESPENTIVNTREVFVCLLRAFNCAHDLILENKAMLTTLTVAVILPLKAKNLKPSEIEEEYRRHDRDRQFLRESPRSARGEERYVCCVCNVGDTLAYVYSQKYGLRELTKGSHDISCNRDMRDALGALGPVDGINPELSNLTLSITTLQKGDIVFVASDGLTDNFDPNVCKFTVNCGIPPVKPPRKTNPEGESSEAHKKTQFAENRASSLRRQSNQRKTDQKLPQQAFLRSKTTLDMRTSKQIVRNSDGVPFVTPVQRYELTLLLMEDVLKRGISGRETRCVTAKKLCENLVNFTFSITAAKRRTLEDRDLYFDNRNGVMVEVSAQEKKARRKRGLEKVQNLPGKLDHVSIVACNVGNFAF